MSLEKLFESLDENVFTPKLKDELTEAFNDAVDKKAKVIADDEIQTRLAEINEKAESYKSYLQSEQKQYVEKINEKAEEYTNLYKKELLSKLDQYLNVIVEHFVKDAEKALKVNLNEHKMKALDGLFANMCRVTGVDALRIMSESKRLVNDKGQSLTKQVNSLTESIFKLNGKIKKQKSTINELLKMGIISQIGEGLTLIQRDKFERLAESIAFTNDKKYVRQLEQLRDTVKGVSEERKVNENKKSKLSFSKTRTLNESNGSKKEITFERPLWAKNY